MGPKKKIILFSMFFGIVSLVLVFLVIWPLVKNIKRNSNEFIETRKEIILSKTKTKELEEFKNFYQKLNPDLERVSQLFIDPEVPIDLIKFWEKTAKDSELSISISPISSKTVEAEFWNSLGFQINLNGFSPNFLRFLEKIENSFYLVEIQNLSIKKSEEKINPVEFASQLFNRVDAILTIKFFTKPH